MLILDSLSEYRLRDNIITTIFIKGSSSSSLWCISAQFMLRMILMTCYHIQYMMGHQWLHIKVNFVSLNFTQMFENKILHKHIETTEDTWLPIEWVLGRNLTHWDYHGWESKHEECFDMWCLESYHQMSILLLINK